MATKGISGVGAAMATGGALLAYAGFKGINPLQALKEWASGGFTGVENKDAGLTAGSTLWNMVSQTGQVAIGASNSALVRAAYAFQGDKYSQARRWQNGYSDCSSFVGKALKLVGIAPPGASTTWDYLASSGWKKIPRAQATAGDLAVNTSHMAMFISNDQGIGQQNTRRNVQVDSMKNLMAGTGSYTCLRYVAPPKGTSALTKSG